MAVVRSYHLIFYIISGISNRAINLIINNLKGVFFRDDDFEHMAFSVVAKWGEIGRTTIRICELSQLENHPIFNENDEIL